ncbi:MAG: hypothetical protein M3379_20650, partial [Acidobacteriota bacterium]|nr:hypothetical protein [Acidobacteriota bacterium]
AAEVRQELEAQGAHFLSQTEADQLTKVVATPQRALNPQIVGKSVEVIAKMAGITIPQGTRCLVAEVGGVGREHPLSMEKLSPILAFYVEDGLERGAARCFEVLSYGGMGHTAGIHTRSREKAAAFGTEMPASRVVVNTPTTHGAIGFSTALPPSMTLGCGSWGGNVTSDNISPWHLMDIKRVAFETRPVPSKRPAASARGDAAPRGLGAHAAPSPRHPITPSPAAGGVSRDEIARIVDRFLSGRPSGGAATQGGAQPLPVAHPHSVVQAGVDIEPQRVAHSGGAAPHPEAAPTAQGNGGGNGSQQKAVPDGQATSEGGGPASASKASESQRPAPSAGAQANGHKAVDFVCEDDVRRAIQKGEKIYTNARTIITPAARDMGEAAEVFAKA